MFMGNPTFTVLCFKWLSYSLTIFACFFWLVGLFFFIIMNILNQKEDFSNECSSLLFSF